MAIQFIITALATIAITVSILYVYRKRKDRFIELDCKFYISGNTDETLDSYKENLGVEISGILGNDFMVKNRYIIDYDTLVVRHRSVKISIKDSINILELPLVILWRGLRKYIFLLDTGATFSIVHSSCVQSLGEATKDNEEYVVRGYGGSGTTSEYVETKLYYAEKGHARK